MNKSVDERLVPPGEYVDALNVRLGSTETTEIGAVENSKGNSKLTTLQIGNVNLSDQATCIGSFGDGVNETLYWFVHDPNNPVSPNGKADLLVSYNTSINSLSYHLVSYTKLNFDPEFLITGVNKIEDLLFFTDDKNPPRYINVKRDYGLPNSFTEEMISVIVKPPGYEAGELAAPQINLFNSNQVEESFLEDIFISFAYRYKYKDNQFSATSLFATAAFEPKTFILNYSTFENEGMQNAFNAAEVLVSTGSSEVIGIDILYKASNSSSIFVVDRLDKQTLGLSNNTLFPFQITSQKIYTLLGSDELLRQYDNVPLVAKAQTIQGNRLIYGNYEDGRDITTANGTPIGVNFVASAQSTEIQNTPLKTPVQDPVTTITDYNIQSTTVSFTSNNATFDLVKTDGSNPYPNGIPQGTVFSFTFAFEFRTAAFGDTTDPNFPTGFIPFNGNSFDLTVEFSTGQFYSNMNAMLLGVEFDNAIGLTNFQPISSAASGTSLTDRFNLLLTNQAPTIANGFNENFTLQLTGITSQVASEAMGIAVAGNSFSITPIGCKFVSTTGIRCFSYAKMNAARCIVTTGKTLDSNSLHSNRDYDVAIVYMDAFGRATPAITSLNSSTHFPAGTSISKNTIQVEVNNQPPFWAKKYKFVLKPSGTLYDTVYVTRFFSDRQDPSIIWLKLEGDDQNIVSAGQRLICKADTSGPLNRLVVETVIDVQSYGGGELGPSGSDSLAGLYASINPSQINLNKSPDTTIHFNRIFNKSTDGSCNTSAGLDPERSLKYPLFLVDSSGNANLYDLPAGSVIRFSFEIWRSAYGGIGAGDDSKSIKWRWDQTFNTTEAYTSFYDWWNQNGIGNLVNGTSNTGEQNIIGSYNDGSFSNPGDVPDPPCYQYIFAFCDQQDANGNIINRANLVMGHDIPRGGPSIDKRPSNMNMRIFINRQSDLIVFETEPQEADPNLFFDSSEMYDIGLDANGDLSHIGNVSNQNVSSQIPAIVNLPFYNCFSFGNGVESFKILDLKVEKGLNLGERTLAQTLTEIKQADRFFGLTYSGIFSGPNNLNNLNEFNLGLVNFKDLEMSFGPIMKLHSRETDMLVLQEDRISYVLLGKNLLSDSLGGGAVSSIPEVLGTQIARIEEYGISFNPESFTSWGSDMYFTDTKRSAVLKLSGGSIKSDQLEVISAYGMRSFFRDQFETQLNTQKIGGFDPYMDEYVLSSNNLNVPTQLDIVPCGTSVQKLNTQSVFKRIFDLGQVTQDVEIDITFSSSLPDVDILATWNGTTVIDRSASNTPPDNITSNTTLTFAKTLAFPNQLELVITPNTEVSYTVDVNCPKQFSGKVVQVVLSSNSDAGKTTHNQYQWFKEITGEPTYFSPLDVSAIRLGNTTNSESLTFFDLKQGIQSLETIPYNTTKIVSGSRSFNTDDFVFDPLVNKFYQFVLDPLIQLNTAADWSLSLIQGKPAITPIINPVTGLFSVSSVLGSYTQSSTVTPTLVLVTDLRRFTKAQFGYDASSSSAACGVPSPCNFFSCTSPPVFTQAQACSLDTNNLPPGFTMQGRGHAGATPGNPRVGDPCFETASCGQQADLAPGFYKLAGNANFVIEIGSGTQEGICISKITC